MRNKFLTITLVPAFLFGCSSSPQQIQHEIAQERLEIKKERVETTLGSIPEWYIDAKPSDKLGYYAVATGFSTDLESSLDIAKLEAVSKLAESYQSEVSGYTEMRKKASGERGELSISTDSFKQKVTDSFDTSGAYITKKAIQAEGVGFRSYVQVHLPYDKYNEAKKKKLQESLDDSKSLETGYNKLQKKIND